jgi:leucyl-tRNA synthetase
MQEDTIEIGLQINGKFRGNMQIPTDASKEEAITLAKETLKSRLDGAQIVKEIYVPKRIVNIVVKS